MSTSVDVKRLGRAVSTPPKNSAATSSTSDAVPLFSKEFIRWFLIPGMLLVCGIAAFAVDVPLARFCYAREYPGFIRHLLDNAEPFGDAYGMLLIVAGFFLLDPQRRGYLPWIIASGLISGLAADGVKLLISRTRPNSIKLDFIKVADTFNGWLPFSEGGSQMQSFPSAHTAVGVGFAIALCRFYPRGRVLFIAMAVMCGMHRVQTCAHFLSDVCVGAAVGWVVGYGILSLKKSPDTLTLSSSNTPSAAV